MGRWAVPGRLGTTVGTPYRGSAPELRVWDSSSRDQVLEGYEPSRGRFPRPPPVSVRPSRRTGRGSWKTSASLPFSPEALSDGTSTREKTSPSSTVPSGQSWSLGDRYCQDGGCCSFTYS